MSTLFGRSSVVSRLRRASRDSRALGALRAARTRLAAGVDRSHVLGALDRVGETVGRWVRGSWLSDWLTAEPEPEVVVVDLRETWTVGPVIAALDRVVGWVAPRWRGSTVERRLASVSNWLGRVVGDSRTAAVLAALLVPPELGERREDESDER